MKQTIKFLVAAVSAMVIAVSAFAQVTTSNIAGKISDAEGVVAGAAVVATHVPTGTNYYSVTDEHGAYRINAVTPGGPYVVSVEMLGYRPVQYTGVYAPLGEVLTLNAALEVEALGLCPPSFRIPYIPNPLLFQQYPLNVAHSLHHHKLMHPLNLYLCFFSYFF